MGEEGRERKGEGKYTRIGSMAGPESGGRSAKILGLWGCGGGTSGFWG